MTFREHEDAAVVGNESFWEHWSNIEWLISGAIAGLFGVASFVWKLATKVKMLEHRLQMNENALEMRLELSERDMQRRHEENVHLQRGMQMRIDGLVGRIDRLFGGNNSRAS